MVVVGISTSTSDMRTTTTIVFMATTTTSSGMTDISPTCIHRNRFLS